MFLHDFYLFVYSRLSGLYYVYVLSLIAVFFDCAASA